MQFMVLCEFVSHMAECINYIGLCTLLVSMYVK